MVVPSQPDKVRPSATHAKLSEIGQLTSHIEKGAAFLREIRGEERPHMELIDDVFVKTRRDIAALVPGKVRVTNDALAGEGRFQLAGIGIPLEPLTPLADHVEHVALAIFHPRNEPTPMPLRVPRQQTRFTPYLVVEIADHVDGLGMRSPATERRAAGNQIGPHRGIGMNVVQ